MPRLDGRLYEWEKSAAKKEADAGKPKKKVGRPPKPKPIETPEPAKPVVIKETFDQALGRIEGELGVADEVRMGRNGRPMKASAKLIKAISASIRGGLTIDKSCILHGVKSGALEKWKRANAGILHFFQKADIEGEAELVAIVRAAAPKDYKAANWLLERRHEWEQRSRTEITGKDGGPVMSVSQQLLASVATGAAPVEKSKPRRPIIDVTPAVKE